MEIRKAKHTDIPKVLPLVRAFHDETLKPFGMGFDPVSVEQTIRTFIEHHVGLVVEKDGEIVGVIGGAIIPSFTDYSVKIFAESIWYVLPAHRGAASGIKLLRLVEDYCRNVGITKVVMIGMSNDDIDRLGSFYARMGYHEVEIHYQKDIKNAPTN